MLFKTQRGNRLDIDKRQIAILHPVNPGKTRERVHRELNPEAFPARHRIIRGDYHQRFACGDIPVVDIKHESFPDTKCAVLDAAPLMDGERIRTTLRGE